MAKRGRGRDADMALLAVEEAEANNGLTVADGGGAAVASLHFEPYGVLVFLGKNKTRCQR